MVEKGRIYFVEDTIAQRYNEKKRREKILQDKVDVRTFIGK